MAEKPVRLSVCKYISVLLRPEIIAIALFRISHLFYEKKCRCVASFFYKAKLLLSGADINPASEIGPGCLIVHTVGTVIFGVIGENATLFTHAVIMPAETGADLSSAPVLGDNVVLGALATIVGPVTIAKNVIIAPFSLIDESISEENCLVSKVKGKAEIKAVKKMHMESRSD